jgi:hypothetical protein
MAKNKVDEIYDLPAIKSQQKEVMAMLIEMGEAMAKISKFLVGNKDQFKGADNLEKLNEAQKEYAVTLEKTQAVLKETEKIEKEKIKLEAKLLAAQTEQSKANAKIKDDITKQNAANRDLVKNSMQVADSLVSLRLQLKSLTKEYNNLSQAERESSVGIAKAENIKALSTEIGAAEQSLGNYTRQVGKYEEAGKAMTQELKAAIREMAAMKMAGADMLEPEKFAELSERAGELRDTIDGAREEMNFFASDTKNIDGVINGIEGLVGAWGAVQGAMALVGGENKELEETFTKLQAVMTVIQSLQAVQNALQKESAFNMLANNLQKKIQVQLTLLEEKAEKGNIVQKYLAVAAQKALNLAQSMSPFGMLLLGIAGLTAGYFALSSVLSKKSKTQKLDNEIMKTSAENSAQERVELGLAVAKIKEAKKGRGDLTKAIDDYNTKFGETGKLTKEIVADEKLFNDLILKQTHIIMLRARAEAYKEKIIEFEKENIKVQTEGISKWAMAWNAIKNVGNAYGFAIANATSATDAMKENNKQVEWASGVYLALTQQIEGLTVAKTEDTKETKANESAYIDWAKRIFEITQELRNSQLALLKESREKEKGENQIKFEQEIYDLQERLKQEPKLREYYEKIIENKKEEHRKNIAGIDSKWDLEAEKKVEENIQLQIEANTKGYEAEMKLQVEANTKQRDIEIKETEKTAEEIILIKTKYAKKEAEIRADFLIDSASKETQKRINSNNVILEEELKALDTQLKNKQISIEDYNKEVAKANAKYADLALQNAIYILEEEIAMLPPLSDKKLELEQQLVDAKNELYAKDRENFIENETEKAEKELEIREAATETIMGLQQTLVDFTNLDFNNKLANIDAEQAAADEKLQNDLASAGINEKYKAELQKKADAETKKREAEKKKIQLEQAKFEKANNLFQASIGMFKEIAKNAGNPLLAAFAAVTGAANIALIAATPLPKFAKGLKKEQNKKGTFGIVADAGPELIRHKDNSMQLFTKEMATYIPAGAEVLTAKETANIFAKPDLRNFEQNSFANNIINLLPLQNELKQLRSDIKNKEHVSISVGEGGFVYSIKKGDSYNKYKNGLQYNG